MSEPVTLCSLGDPKALHYWRSHITSKCNAKTFFRQI